MRSRYERRRRFESAAAAAADAAPAMGGDAAVPAAVDGDAVSFHGDAAAHDVQSALRAVLPPPAAAVPAAAGADAGVEAE